MKSRRGHLERGSVDGKTPLRAHFFLVNESCLVIPRTGLPVKKTVVRCVDLACGAIRALARIPRSPAKVCLLYTSDAADE